MFQEDITESTDAQEATGNDDAAQDAQDATQSDGINDPEVLRSELDKARKEAAKYRTTARDTSGRVKSLEQQLSAIGKALGLESDDPDPNALTSELENVRNQLRNERLENRFTRIAGSVNADSDLTMAYLSHKGQLSDLDPEADDFEATLKGRIEAALKANPKLRQGDTPAQAGAEFGRGTQDGRTQDMNAVIRGIVPRPR